MKDIPTSVAYGYDECVEMIYISSMSKIVDRDCCRLTFDLKYCISIESLVEAECKGIRFSFVRPTTAAKELKTPTKHL